jgi:hypothetical protein
MSSRFSTCDDDVPAHARLECHIIRQTMMTSESQCRILKHARLDLGSGHVMEIEEPKRTPKWPPKWSPKLSPIFKPKKLDPDLGPLRQKTLAAKMLFFMTANLSRGFLGGFLGGFIRGFKSNCFKKEKITGKSTNISTHVFTGSMEDPI